MLAKVERLLRKSFKDSTPSENHQEQMMVFSLVSTKEKQMRSLLRLYVQAKKSSTQWLKQSKTCFKKRTFLNLCASFENRSNFISRWSTFLTSSKSVISTSNLWTFQMRAITGKSTFWDKNKKLGPSLSTRKQSYLNFWMRQRRLQRFSKEFFRIWKWN